MLLSELQQLFSRDTVLLLQHITEKGYTFTYGEAMRSQEQAEIYAKQGKGILDSLHCKRLAIDINLFKDGVYLQDSKSYELFGSFWESLSPCNRWGGRFKKPDGSKFCDSNHFERNDRPSK